MTLCECCGQPDGVCPSCKRGHSPAVGQGKCEVCIHGPDDPEAPRSAFAGPARRLEEAQAVSVPPEVRDAPTPKVKDSARAYEQRLVEGEIGRALNRRYNIKLDRLDIGSLRELRRLIRDLVDDGTARARRAQQQPWRRP